MRYVYIRSHAFDRKDVSKTLRVLAPTLERHLIKLYFGEDRYKNHWIKEIDNYLNNELDFLIKKKTSISKDGIHAMIFEESAKLEDRIVSYLKNLEEDGYFLNKDLSVADAVPKFKSFYDLLSTSLYRRYESRKLGQKIDVRELLQKSGLI